MADPADCQEISGIDLTDESRTVASMLPSCSELTGTTKGPIIALPTDAPEALLDVSTHVGQRVLPRPSRSRTRVPCPGAHCGRSTAGHDLTPFLKRQLDRTPWLWRLGVVTDVARGAAVLDCPPSGGLLPLAGLRIWHHLPVADFLACGDRVLVHEPCGALDLATSVFNVAITVPGGRVPVPVDFDTWARDGTAPVIPLR